jgi:FkbM family methyltransferase
MMMRATRSMATWLRGHPRLAGWALKLLPDVPVTITVAPIGPLRIRTRRNRSYWLRHPLILESFPLAVLRALIKPGDVVYDVGANIGLYTRFCIGYFHAGRVVAFEPMSANRPQLRRNIELGGIRDRVTVLPYALADVDSIQELQIDDMSSASATLAVVTDNGACQGRRQYGLPPKSEKVSCRRLDSVIAEEKLPPPKVIKVDIEGAENLFITGAAECLAKSSPHLLVELHGADKARAVYDLLTTFGYACAGQVGPHLLPAGYGRLDDTIMQSVCNPYDVHFLVATRNPAELPESISPFQA